MWRLGCQRIESCIAWSRATPRARHEPAPASRRTFKGIVSSQGFLQITSSCEEIIEPRKPTGKVTVIGAASDIGLIACLFLKQQKAIKTLAMYDEPPRALIGCAHDMAHIDTSTAIEAYLGKPYLKEALYDADVVLICGGRYPCPPYCGLLDRDLFFYNLQYVRTTTIAVAQFAPQAVLCIQTPPVDANFTLAKYTLERARAYNKRRLIGVNSINAMRANQLYCALADQDPTTLSCPVVGGTGRCTRVPVFSAMPKFVRQAKEQIECITRLVREADELICKVKGNAEQAHLSIGFATARCVVSVQNGIFGEKGTLVDSALVEQMKPAFGLKICATPVSMGPDGISTYQIPKLQPHEEKLLQNSTPNLEDMLNLGRCYAVSEDYFIHPKLCPPCIPMPIAEVCSPVISP